MSYSAPSQSNVYIASLEATDELQVQFSRNEAAFAVNRWAQVRPVKRTVGKYLRIRPDEGMRLLQADGSDDIWPDGADSPNGSDNLVQFEIETYTTKRYAKAATLGQLAVDQAEFLVEAAQQEQLIQRNMTRRTSLAAAAITGANWGSNTASAQSLINAAGYTGTQNFVTGGSDTQPNIQIALLNAAMQINIATGGLIQASDIRVVMNPRSAIRTCTTAEIRGTLIQSPFALPVVEGQKEVNQKWGLPPRLYGFELEIDETVKETSAQGASSVAQNYVIPDGALFLLARPGGAVDEREGDEDESPVRIYSTVMGFAYEDMKVEANTDGWNRRTTLRVSDNICYVLSSPLSGFYMTSIFG